MDLMMVIIAAIPVVIGRWVWSGLPDDVRRRVAVIFGVAVVVAVMPWLGPAPWRARGSTALTLVALALAAGMTWRVPTRLRTWAMDAAEVSLGLLAVGVLVLSDEDRGTGVAVVGGLAFAWALAGAVGGLRGRGFEARPITTVALAASVVAGVTILLVWCPPESSTGMAAGLVAWLVTAGLVPMTRPDPRDVVRQLAWGAMGAVVVVSSLWAVGAPLDERAAVPALAGALLVATGARSRSPFRKARPTSSLRSFPEESSVQRETLVVLERLADPELHRADNTPSSLEHVFPGARIELLRNPDTLPAVGPRGPPLDRHLMTMVCREGLLRGDASEALPGRVKSALRRLGRDVVLLPVLYDASVYGLLVVRGMEPTDDDLVQLRRFADLLGHRLETQRLYAALQHKKRLADLGTFAAALVHDLRGPLATARLEAQLMERTATGLQQESIVNIVRALDRVLADLSGALDFTRPLDLDSERVELGVVLGEVIASHRAQAEQLAVELAFDDQSEGAQVVGDQARLRRVFDNLVRNALQASPAHTEVRVAVVLEGAGVTVTVDDQGPGIDPALGDRIFEPFVTSKATGVGLGLVIVRKIVEGHDGKISVAESTSGGACMKVWLPMARAGGASGP